MAWRSWQKVLYVMRPSQSGVWHFLDDAAGFEHARAMVQGRRWTSGLKVPAWHQRGHS